MLWEFFKRYTFEVLLGTVIVIVAGLVFITWRIKKVEDPEEIWFWKCCWIPVFLLLVLVGFYWFIADGLGRMGAH
tara:strand:- start:101 stop:325 length:225 start_codon:yes stop_codon:yes gene_type:complete